MSKSVRPKAEQHDGDHGQKEKQADLFNAHLFPIEGEKAELQANVSIPAQSSKNSPAAGPTDIARLVE